MEYTADKIFGNIDLKKTKMRIKIIETFEKQDLTAHEVYQELKQSKKSVSLQTIYDNVKKFNDLGILTKYSLDGKDYYRLNKNAEKEKIPCEHIVVCIKCKKTYTIPSCPMTNLDVNLENLGQIKRHTLTVEIICNDCVS